MSKSRRPPRSWRLDFPIISELRQVRDAPVDSVGCERLADTRAPKRDFEWQSLVAAMLSSQTKDQATAEAMKALHRHGNTAARIASTPVQKLDRLISNVGFHTTKAKNIQAAARICLRKHGGRVPCTLEGLLSLPGVGPKMAYLTLHAAFDTQQGLCVDTHVHRIANALGWVETQLPEQTRQALQAWLPQEHWSDFNVLLVGLGQQQQQDATCLVERCLGSPSPRRALELLSRIGLKLSAKRFPALADAACKRPQLRSLVEP